MKDEMKKLEAAFTLFSLVMLAAAGLLVLLGTAPAGQVLARLFK